MNVHAFLETDAARGVLERAATIAGLPISLHHRTDQAEELLWNAGGCAACAFVNDLQWGSRFCNRSRAKPAASSSARQRPVPFLCHMQFPCVSVPAVFGEPDAPTLTLGPYCPVEAPGSLERDALEQLPDVAQESFDDLPFALDDVPLRSGDAVYALAEWTAETLTALFVDRLKADAPVLGGFVAAAAPDAQATRRKHSRAVREAYQAPDLLAALVAGDSARFRSLVAIVLDDGDAARKVELAAVRGRALAMAGAIIEAAERAGYPTAEVWPRVPALSETLAATDRPHEMAAALRDTLRGLRGAGARAASGARDFAQVYRAITEGIVDGVTLESVAKTTGDTPDALSKRLKRKLNMSFSEYKGRVRIDRARELLRATELGIGEVARRVGIEDTSNFSRLFRQHEGISPGKYRAKHKRRKSS